MNIKNINEFSSDVLDIINKMSFNNGKNLRISGTMKNRKLRYASDYDLYQVVDSHSINNVVSQFQKIIINLLNTDLCYIGDIKAGVIENFRVLSESYEDYDANDAKNKLDYIYNLGIVKKNDYNYINQLLKEQISIKDYFILQDLLKYHIVRWKPKQILNGYKIINNYKYFLKDALNTDSLFKLDVIALTENNKFTEFSIIYELKINNKSINTPIRNIEESLREDIQKLSINKKYYKMAKRIASLFRFKNKDTFILDNLFNSNLGIVNLIISDIETLLYLIENEDVLPTKRIQFEIDQFKPRLSYVNILSDPLRNKILSTINNLLTKNKINKELYLLKLEKIKSILTKILNLNAKKYLLKYKIYNI
jgi:hypothetical protein